MNTNIQWRRTATGLLTMALGMSAPGLAAAAGATLGEQNVRTLLNTAVSYHHHTFLPWTWAKRPWGRRIRTRSMTA